MKDKDRTMIKKLTFDEILSCFRAYEKRKPKTSIDKYFNVAIAETKGATRKKISKDIGVSVERIRQIQAKNEFIFRKYISYVRADFLTEKK